MRKMVASDEGRERSGANALDVKSARKEWTKKQNRRYDAMAGSRGPAIGQQGG